MAATDPTPVRTGPALRAVLAAERLMAPLVPLLLRRRLREGKEDPARWREKLGESGLRRPEGPLVWMHAVGLGEVMALRGLVDLMAARRPDLSFLLTSFTLGGAEVLAANLPAGSRHQFLPADAPRWYRPFLDRWRPDLSIWSEQEIWPGILTETHRRGIPLALVNARIGQAALARRLRARGLFRDLYARFRLISAQDAASAGALRRLGAPDTVQVHPSLKMLAPPLAADAGALAALRAATRGRRLWCLASSHAADEEVALAAHERVLARDPRALLVVAPRFPARGGDIAGRAGQSGFAVARRAQGAMPQDGTQVYVADTLGEMGLWYRLCQAVAMGGSFGGTGGHNPWEPARLGAAVLHGPGTANFAADYAALDAAGGALRLEGEGDLARALASDLSALPPRAAALAEAARDDLDDLARQLLGLLPGERAG